MRGIILRQCALPVKGYVMRQAITVMLIAVCGFSVCLASPAPSKEAAADSIRTAHDAMVRISGLSERQQYDQFVCEFWFYESLSDKSNFGKLTDDDRKELRKIVGKQSFFLHRFTPKAEGGTVYEIFITEDGAKVLGSRLKGRKKEK